MKKDHPKTEYDFTRFYTVFEKSYQKPQTHIEKSQEECSENIFLEVMYPLYVFGFVDA